jgi:hypothetical protein
LIGKLQYEHILEKCVIKRNKGMKNKLLLLFILLSSAYSLYALSNTGHEPYKMMNELTRTNQNGMMVLGAWGVSNLIAGSILSYGREPSRQKYFWQMNAAWNTVNITIAAIGYFGAEKDWSTISEFINITENYKRAFLFNAGLDVGYIMTGFYLKELANRYTDQSMRLSGYGNAIILQGAFLMVFDITKYFIHQNYYKVNIAPWLDTLTMANGLSITYTF